MLSRLAIFPHVSLKKPRKLFQFIVYGDSLVSAVGQEQQTRELITYILQLTPTAPCPLTQLLVNRFNPFNHSSVVVFKWHPSHKNTTTTARVNYAQGGPAL